MPQSVRIELLVLAALLGACGSGRIGPAARPPPPDPTSDPGPASLPDGGSDPGPGDGGTRLALTADTPAVFVGERARLTPVFDGESGDIEGIGAVQSGAAVETAVLSRTTTFALRVSRGGEQLETRTTVLVSYRNRIRALADAPIAQTNHVAAALPDASAIQMGGNTSETPLVPDSSRTQIFDPATERFLPGPDLTFSVQAQVFTSGAPLVAGGFLLVGTGLDAESGPPLHPVITQIFDPGTPGFRRAGDAVGGAISFRTATPLLDGGVLLSGGFDRDVNPVSAVASRYHPGSGQWAQVGDMLQVRVAHTATLLRDGRVLVAGGLSCCREAGPTFDFYESSAEIYDPATDRFTQTGSMATARGSHAAALLPDGRVLITGGNGNDPAAPPLDTEIFDPATGRFTSGGELQEPRDSHAAVGLTDGRVLVIGGEVPPEISGLVGVEVTATEIFDPASGQWSAGPFLNPVFYAATVTLLTNGKVLVFGGQDAGGSPRAEAALFE